MVLHNRKHAWGTKVPPGTLSGAGDVQGKLCSVNDTGQAVAQRDPGLQRMSRVCARGRQQRDAPGTMSQNDRPPGLGDQM